MTMAPGQCFHRDTDIARSRNSTGNGRGIEMWRRPRPFRIGTRMKEGNLPLTTIGGNDCRGRRMIKESLDMLRLDSVLLEECTVGLSIVSDGPDEERLLLKKMEIPRNIGASTTVGPRMALCDKT